MTLLFREKVFNGELISCFLIKQLAYPLFMKSGYMSQSYLAALSTLTPV